MSKKINCNEGVVVESSFNRYKQQNISMKSYNLELIWIKSDWIEYTLQIDRSEFLIESFTFRSFLNKRILK